MILLLATAAWARPASTGSVDHATHPIRCHWERAEDAERCDTVLTWAAHAWDAQIDTIGFSAPLPDGGEGGSDALDLYIGVSSTAGGGEAWVDCDGGDGSCIDADPDDGRAAAASYVVIDARTPDEALPGYVVHELNHVTQYAADYAEPYLSVWEGTAVAAEVWTLGTADASQVADYQASPWASAVLHDGYFLDEEHGLWSWYEYGAAAWILWLDARHGDGAGSVAPALWEAMTQEGYADEPDALDAWSTVAGASWEDEVLLYAHWRARLRDGDDVGVWAGAGAEAWREGVLAASAEVAPSMPVYPLGMAVWDLEGFTDCDSLSFEVVGDGTTRWEVLGTLASADEGITPAAAAKTLCSPVRSVVVVNLGPEGFDAGDALEPGTFTLKFDGRKNEADAGPDPEPIPEATGGCACGTGVTPVRPAGGGGAIVLAALAMWRGRRPRAIRPSSSGR